MAEVKMIKGEEYLETQYAGFAKNKSTGAYEMVFKTFMSELLCKNRTEEAIRSNPSLYEETDKIIIKKRICITRYTPFEPIEEVTL